MQDLDLYSYQDYKTYLRDFLECQKSSISGIKGKLAKALNCQSGFISQVLNGTTHFTLEHGINVNQFCSHNKDKSHFYLLLISHERAGTEGLKNYYKEQIEEIANEKKKIKNKINIHSKLNEKDYMQYYSSWEYAAIHILTSIPEYQTKNKIAEKLNLTLKKVSFVLEFLVSKKLCFEELGLYKIGNARIHLSGDSPLIVKHHTNWRIEALKALDLENKNNLHFSGVWSLSKKDIDKIKEILTGSLQKMEPILQKSPEEELMGLNLDLFVY
jgi:uncharacterized protein (TIGR02147 family)